MAFAHSGRLALWPAQRVLARRREVRHNRLAIRQSARGQALSPSPAPQNRRTRSMNSHELRYNSVHWTRQDDAAALWLLSCALLLAWPVWTGGAASYLDNPVHLAEIYALAQSQSPWIDIGFLGAPVGQLHSPLWVRLITSAVRLGLPLEPAYSALLVVGLVAPALALFAGARRQLSTPGAALAAYVLLVQRPTLAGVESPLGGMYPFYLGMALCIALAFFLARPGGSTRSLAGLAALVGVIGLTHTFALLVAGLIGALALARLGIQRLWRQTAAVAAALAVGALASAAYWLQPLLDGQAVQRSPQNLDAEKLLRLLVFPHDLVAMISRHPAVDLQLWGLDGAAMAALLLAGLAGAALQVRTALNRTAPEPTAVLGLGLSAILAGLLFAALPGTSLPLLGPVSWRFLYPLRLGLALAALPLLARWPVLQRGALANPRVLAPAAVLLTGACLLWGWPLRQQVAPTYSAELAEVNELWSYLRSHRGADWGRVYLQNTYQTAPLQQQDGSPRLLAQSHLLALTSHSTGVRQLGPYYGVTPYATDWTASAHDNLFGVPTSQPRVLAHTLTWLVRSGCSHLVLADPRLIPGFIALGLEPLWQGGRFALLQLPRSLWPSTVQGRGATAKVDHSQAHRLVAAIQVDQPGGQVRLPVAWSPHWRVQPPAGLAIRGDKMGLTVVSGQSPGNYTMILEYVTPRLGLRISTAAWLTVVALTLLPRRRRAVSAPRGDYPADSTP